MAHTQIVDLLANRNLMLNNFDGYKINYDRAPKEVRKPFIATPHRARPAMEEYSLLHAELFTMPNLLHVDPWSHNLSYFINCLGQVECIVSSTQTQQTNETNIVYQIPEHMRCATPIAGNYNYSLCFISNDLCVLCTNMDMLLLLQTGDRNLHSSQWLQVTNKKLEVGTHNFVLYNARLDMLEGEEQQISLALGSIHKATAGEQYLMRIYCASWQQYNEQWLFKVNDVLEGKGSLYYCAFESYAKSLVICSNDKYAFRSQNSMTTEQLQTVAKNKLDFSWKQDEQHIYITFGCLSGKYSEAQYAVQVDEAANIDLSIACEEQELLSGQLFCEVHTPKIHIENQHVKIVLNKKLSALWPQLFQDNNLCQTPMLTNDGIDCDRLQDTQQLEHNALMRYDLHSKTMTHIVRLGSEKPIFSSAMHASEPPAIALSHNTDAAIWQMQTGNAWTWQHEANLPGYGYLADAKPSRMFCDCAPNYSFYIILDAYGSLFIYRNPSLVSNAGKAIQNNVQGIFHLLRFDADGEILGMCVSNEAITLLTDREVICLPVI